MKRVLKPDEFFFGNWPWILTSEYLPESGVPILFDVSVPGCIIPVKFGHFIAGDFFHVAGFYDTSAVRSWTYVPDPYRFSLPKIYNKNNV